jgi:hypothetical protein
MHPIRNAPEFRLSSSSPEAGACNRPWDEWLPVATGRLNRLQRADQVFFDGSVAWWTVLPPSLQKRAYRSSRHLAASVIHYGTAITISSEQKNIAKKINRKEVTRLAISSHPFWYVQSNDEFKPKMI